MKRRRKLDSVDRLLAAVSNDRSRPLFGPPESPPRAAATREEEPVTAAELAAEVADWDQLCDELAEDGQDADGERLEPGDPALTADDVFDWPTFAAFRREVYDLLARHDEATFGEEPIVWPSTRELAQAFAADAIPPEVLVDCIRDSYT